MMNLGDGAGEFCFEVADGITAGNPNRPTPDHLVHDFEQPDDCVACCLPGSPWAGVRPWCTSLTGRPGWRRRNVGHLCPPTVATGLALQRWPRRTAFAGGRLLGMGSLVSRQGHRQRNVGCRCANGSYGFGCFSGGPRWLFQTEVVCHDMRKKVIPFPSRKVAPSRPVTQGHSRIMIQVGAQRYSMNVPCTATALPPEPAPPTTPNRLEELQVG